MATCFGCYLKTRFRPLFPKTGLSAYRVGSRGFLTHWMGSVQHSVRHVGSRPQMVEGLLLFCFFILGSLSAIQAQINFKLP